MMRLGERAGTMGSSPSDGLRIAFLAPNRRTIGTDDRFDKTRHAAMCGVARLLPCWIVRPHRVR